MTTSWIRGNVTEANSKGKLGITFCWVFFFKVETVLVKLIYPQHMLR